MKLTVIGGGGVRSLRTDAADQSRGHGPGGLPGGGRGAAVCLRG